MPWVGTIRVGIPDVPIRGTHIRIAVDTADPSEYGTSAERYDGRGRSIS
jgi:hypothetical protein